MISSGKLRHRITVQKPVEQQNEVTGIVDTQWIDFINLWASIEPLSAREFVASQSEVSKITTRITIRYNSDITDKMRVKHHKSGKDLYYNIEGILSDKESGIEYITMPCSEGVRYDNGEIFAGIPVNNVLPFISGNHTVGSTLTGNRGTWTNSPTSYLYQWYVDDRPVSGASGQLTGSDTSSFIIPDNVGSEIMFVASAVNSNGSSDAAFSQKITIT